MFSTLSDYIFGSTTDPLDGQSSGDQGQQCQNDSQIPEEEDEWVIVKNEEESFLLSTEVVTRSRVNIHEDLSRENFLIEHPLSLSSEEIEMRGIKLGRRSKRKAKRSSGTTNMGNPSRNYQILIPNLQSPMEIQRGTNSRALTLISLNINNSGQGFQKSCQDKRRGNYHYKRYSGVNNDRKCGQHQRGSVLR